MPEGKKDRAIIYLQEADAGSVRELSKYVAKGSGFYHNPEQVAEFYEAIKGRRCFAVLGRHNQRCYRLYREMEKRVRAGKSLGDFESFLAYYKRRVEGSELTPAHQQERLREPQEMVEFFNSARRSLEAAKQKSDPDVCPHGRPLVCAGPLENRRDLSCQGGVLSLSESAYEVALARAQGAAARSP